MNCRWEKSAMPHLSPPTLTHDEQEALLRATRRNLRDHLIYSLALGTGLRLAEIVGLNVGDVYTPEGKPKNRVRLRPEIARNGRAGDVFLPDALLVKLDRKSTRLNSSHGYISYAVFCLKKKKNRPSSTIRRSATRHPGALHRTSPPLNSTHPATSLASVILTERSLAPTWSTIVTELHVA